MGEFDTKPRLPLWLDPGAKRLRMDFDQDRRNRIEIVSKLIRGLSEAIPALKSVGRKNDAVYAGELLADVIASLDEALQEDDQV